MAVILTDDSNFETTVSQQPLVIVKYYADWCGSCKLFAPKYKRLSNDERFQTIAFIEVNAETSPEARKRGAVNNLPTFAIFKNGEMLASLSTSKEEAVVALLEQLQAY